jgi:predicted acylesterase/phospholipase RssA
MAHGKQREREANPDPKFVAAEQTARDIIAGKRVTPTEAIELAKTLHRARRFGLARKALERCQDDPSLQVDAALRRAFAHKLSLSTYKDPDLPEDTKFDTALAILQRADDLRTSTDQETLGQAGAIHKRQWERTTQARHLETSLGYYLRGHEQGVTRDFGYTAINAAFVLDCLAELESAEGRAAPAQTSVASQRVEQARRIRRDIVDHVPPLAQQPRAEWLGQTWWFLATVGEAWFGLDDHAQARQWFARAATLPGVPDWERESTARQLAELLRLKQAAASRGGPAVDPVARDALRQLLGDQAAALESVVRGRVGLALSGGGFRASFFHIGVLARLAELDLLRHVEYLSCVSGGSIIGAQFYLEVRKLLQDKADAEIGRDDYVRIVQKIEADFFAGVATNVRTRIAAEWWTNLKLIFQPGYSRTKRVGELYESMLFARVQDGGAGKARWLNELTVAPRGAASEFAPKDHNWRRTAKVPILVLNATTLNSGHNWQFTATWMGEPPGSINSEVDANYRLRRMYYDEAPGPYRSMRLGDAVAASACVPGLFEPLTLTDLYERLPPGGDHVVRPVVRLVDGGVHDNQGISALLEQGCNVLLVSDASGQMDDKDHPSSGMVGVPLRSNSILQARIRVSQFEQLAARRRTALLRGLVFMHLKKDLETVPVDWIESQDRSPPVAAPPLTSYGVQRDIQRQLAAVRTDLDSFSEAEACALMDSAYLMARRCVTGADLGFPIPEGTVDVPWNFRRIEPLLKDGRSDSPLRRQLGAADRQFFRVWLLLAPLRAAAVLAGLALLALAGYAAFVYWDRPLWVLDVKWLLLTLLGIAAPLLGLGLLGKVINYRKTVSEVIVGLAMATLGFVLARIHLHVFNRLFLWQGSLRHIIGTQDPRR